MQLDIDMSPSINEPLLGGVYAPCSLRYFTPFSLLPSIFLHSLLFTNFHRSFSIFLCSLLLFLFFPLLPDNFSCSMLHFPILCCSLLPFPNFCAPCSQITFSLLPAPFFILGHAPCSLVSQFKGHSPCSLITPNGGSIMNGQYRSNWTTPPQLYIKGVNCHQWVSVYPKLLTNPAGNI